MNYYLAGTAVTLPVNFIDADGNPLQVSEGAYRIVDQDGTEIKAATSFDITQSKVIVEAQFNTIQPIDLTKITAENMDAIQIDQMRVLEFDLVDSDGNSFAYNVSYMITPRERLIVGLNSFQNLNQAKLTAMTIPETDAFLAESDVRIVAALTEARLRICTLNIRDFNLQTTTPLEYQKLPEPLKAALRKAQVAEANAILGGGDPIELAMNQGLQSKTIGETHESYFSGKQIKLTVSKAALRYLGSFVSTSKVIARA
ncbi:hypothetical protein [Acinetobacter nosocomialis]|uniref:hypothetical protein n=1 Tax=Acinetobacter nosocomialis TaxID=106654 RepID=UPI0033BB60F7